MANVLSVLEKASDEDIRNQVATLEVVTIGNIMSTEGKEALNKAAGVVNSIGRFFGAKNRLVDDLKPKSIEEQIKDKLEEHAYDSRIALDMNLRKLLAERLSLRDNPSDERIAKELVNRAARHMDIDEVLAPAEKIDAVFQRYMERLEKQMREAFDKADEATKEKFKKRIRASLDAMTEEQREEVRQALKTDEVTVETVLKVMRTTGITGVMAVAGSTFGAYLFLSVIIHGVFTTLLGVTVPFAVYSGAASALSVITGPVGWAALGIFGLWQYMRGSSKVDGEIFCQLIFTARFLYKKRFAPEDEDLPNWIVGRDEETKKEIAESDASYKVREENLQKAQYALEEAERKLREAQKNEEAVKAELEAQRKYIADIQEQVDNYDRIRKENEARLGVLEGQLAAAASEEKKSALTINKLKRDVAKQREKIVQLKEVHEANLETLQNAPRKETEISELIAQAEAESMKEMKAALDADGTYADYKESRDEERFRRKDKFKSGLEAWIEQEYGGNTCELDDVLLNQLAMSNNEHNKAVLKAMKQVLDADAPKDLGDKVRGESLRLPIKGTGMFLVYEVEAGGKLNFLKFTDGDSLAELDKEKEERRKLENAISQMKEEMDAAMRKIAEQSDNKIIRDRQIRDWFDRALNETQKELDILSPWMRDYVVNEKFYKKIERLLENGVVVKILYGIKERSKGKGIDSETKDVATMLEERFSKYRNFHIEETNSHGKMLLCDNRFYLMTSYNFLSFAGNYNQAYTRGETGICSENERNIEELREEYFMF